MKLKDGFGLESIERNVEEILKEKSPVKPIEPSEPFNVEKNDLKVENLEIALRADVAQAKNDEDEMNIDQEKIKEKIE